MRVLLTGAAGFIGFHLAKKLLDRGDEVVGVDNVNDYYEVGLKRNRLALLENAPKFTFEELDLADAATVSALFSRVRPEVVVHLAAQAGVRYSLINPHVYGASNLTAFLNVLEGCRSVQPRHFVFASSSSVYGANTKVPFSVHDNVDHPVSLYAATKKSNELMAHCYSGLFDIPITGLRFFTVYGPWGRPDMAYFSFTRAILEGKTIDVFNQGEMERDFTYIDDIVEGVARVMDRPAQPNPEWSGDAPDPASSRAPYRIYNIGNHAPVKLMEFIRILERALGTKASLNFLPMQAGEVPITFADVDDLSEEIGFRPRTSIQEGLSKFVAWYREYYRV